ncbi:riboflavin biosynthesis protein PYRD, chloroplastic isoform X1 [Nymphaea colorata]|nr:riboflavin biosynthesis protein PYRD, chloroplastic isoform X1 [Nymphaea colorata]XP_031502296.1 riboflavin biosynthesis protein PYRD, chloroplastic isoform X1 [Nymphaea colorata]XP_031502297.1 riboflavin biosynthesis protein PYRD, chloroplastic isoform X1 [Nymphaea colorata]XP_031502298.1 riboflavin biosynthesis protein PYRD, chloroplastic isoform X1 [Nymphaea colorata]
MSVNHKDQWTCLPPEKERKKRSMSTLTFPSSPVHIQGKRSPVSVLGLCRNSSVVDSITTPPSKPLDEFSKLVSGFHKVKGVHGSHRGSGSHGFVIRCDSSIERDDSFYMNRCVELARKALGFTSPNPMVGCVIVKDGEVVGEGFHPKAGQPHAEVFALRAAGSLANQATAYVSLEPCNHYGRTPPCTEALIQANIKRVVVGMVDPNPIVASKGVEKLRKSGIDVTVGVQEELCQKLNEAYIHRMRTGKPFVTLRYSLSFNGVLLNEIGEGTADVGGYFSQLLQQHDGVIISGLDLTNNALLLSREIGANQPVQIIIAKSLERPLNLSIFRNATTKALVFAEKNAFSGEEIQMALKNQSIEIVTHDQINMDVVLEQCSKLGLCSVLVDMRGNDIAQSEIIKQAMKDAMINKVVMEILPVWCNASPGSVDIARDLKLKDLQTRLSKNSVIVEGYVS